MLIDEGLIAGLNFEVKVGPEIQYEFDEEGREQRFGQVEITGSESAINWDEFTGCPDRGHSSVLLSPVVKRQQIADEQSILFFFIAAGVARVTFAD